MKHISRSFTVVLALAAASFLLLLLLPSCEGSVHCSFVEKNISPCRSFIKEGGNQPPTACCTGLRNLQSAVANSTSEGVKTCHCIVKMNIVPTAGVSDTLTKECNVNVPGYPLTIEDCNKMT